MSNTLTLYNSLSRQLEPFKPLKPNRVSMYVCGPTVYDESHLGHARCYVVWDVLYRLLQCLGYDVTYVRNITDVDDKILMRASESNQPPIELTQHFTQRFHQVMHTLHVLPPTKETKATDYVPSMIRLVETLIANGSAYQSPDGTIYFRVSAKSDYGKLKGQSLHDMVSGARVEVSEQKESPLDFALWKPAPENEPLVWPSPWGWGRPGWHLECSTMVHDELGPQIDIHCGGLDLIFPHHENEIAQSECFTGHTPFAHYWLHNGFVNVSGDKMSKSLGNFATITQLLDVYDANTLRFFIISHHWRSPVDFTHDALESAKNRVEKLHRNVQEWVKASSLAFPAQPYTQEWVLSSAQQLHSVLLEAKTPMEQLISAWLQALLDDMNTAKAMTHINDMVSHLNTQIASQQIIDPNDWQWFLMACFGLGFDFSAPLNSAGQLDTLFNQLLSLGKAIQPTVSVLFPEQPTAELLMQYLIEARQQYRVEKRWAESDQIRDRLQELGIQLKDRKDAPTVWEVV